MPDAPLTFYEFFAGGGMARTGLGAGWRCLFANDFDPRKTAVYRDNFGGDDLAEGDVWAVGPDQLPGRADLAWASSPCQDLSLAGRRAGLGGARSSAFWGFWRLIEALAAEGRAPRAVVIENVVGLLTSHGGADFAALCGALARAGYRFGALEMDAALFTPQSRPRMFLVAVRTASPDAARAQPALPFHTGRVVEAYARLPDDLKACWQWWRASPPPVRNANLDSVLEPDSAVKWRDAAQTAALVAQLTPRRAGPGDAAVARDGRAIAAVYRRIRVEKGLRVQRAELRLDGLAGCLRTAGGGSSRQFLLFAEPGRIRSRLLSAREGARLMGLPDDYRLPRAVTTALHVAGDGVAVPVVRWLSQSLLEPLLLAPEQTLAAE